LIVNPVAGGIDKSEIIEATASFLQNLSYIKLQGALLLKLRRCATLKPESLIVAGVHNRQSSAEII
jgi:hypothetical protein